MCSSYEVRPAISAHGSMYETVTTRISNVIRICFRKRWAKDEIRLRNSITIFQTRGAEPAAQDPNGTSKTCIALSRLAAPHWYAAAPLHDHTAVLLRYHTTVLPHRHTAVLPHRCATAQPHRHTVGGWSVLPGLYVSRSGFLYFTPFFLKNQCWRAFPSIFPAKNRILGENNMTQCKKGHRLSEDANTGYITTKIFPLLFLSNKRKYGYIDHFAQYSRFFLLCI